jgi:LuxR family maltose regulon positive regulatory protein
MLRCAEGDPVAAAALVADVPEDATRPYTHEQIALLRAQIAASDGDVRTAERALREALEHARPEQRRRPFAEAGAWLRSLIRQFPDLVVEHAWLGSSLGPRAFGPVAAPSVVVDPLTTREIEVLQRLARALSTDDIANELYLSVNTVKTHLKSIYRKLGTSGRSAAARRARELNIIDDVPNRDRPEPPTG